jgi:stage V sporulation protein B
MYVYNITVSNGISCLLSIAVGGIVYGLLILVFGVFKYSYIKNRFFR